MVSTEDKYRFTCTHGIYCSERSLLNSMFSNIRQEWKSNWLSEVAENTVILSSQVTSLKYLALEKRKATLKTLTHVIRTMCLLKADLTKECAVEELGGHHTYLSSTGSPFSVPGHKYFLMSARKEILSLLLICCLCSESGLAHMKHQQMLERMNEWTDHTPLSGTLEAPGPFAHSRGHGSRKSTKSEKAFMLTKGLLRSGHCRISLLNHTGILRSSPGVFPVFKFEKARLDRAA